MTRARCAACGSLHWIRHKHSDVTVCFFCGSWLEANNLLHAHSIPPNEILDILSSASHFTGITIEVAKSAIEAFRLKHDKPH
jgi:hypothetical protein